MGCVRVPAPTTVRGDPEWYFHEFQSNPDRLTKEEVEAYLATLHNQKDRW